MTRPLLLDYQHRGVEWLQGVGRGLLADEPGMGKTRQLIEASDGGRTLVVAPSMVIVGGTWRDEIEKWADHPERFVVAPYSMLNARRAQARVLLDEFGDPMEGPDGAPLTKTTIRPVANAVREDYQGRWDTMILDECHYVKGPKTTWTVAAKKVAKRADQVFCATGTPVPNWAHELFVVLQLIHGRYAPGQEWGSFWRWAERWFDTRPTRFSNNRPQVGGDLLGCLGTQDQCEARPPDDPCDHWRRFTADNLGGRYLRRTWRAEDLPPITQRRIETPLGRAGRRIYPELVREYVSTVRDSEVVAWTTGARNVLLDKLTVSPWFLSPEGEPRGGKLARLRADLRGRTRPTLVLAHYRDVVEACARVAESVDHRTGYIHGGVSKVRAAKLVAAFKRGELDTLVGSLEILAEGLTLTVADLVIFVETSYKPYRNEQALRRIWRLGQDKPVVALNYETPNTIDSKKRVLLATKTDRQMRLLRAAELKRILVS